MGEFCYEKTRQKSIGAYLAAFCGNPFAWRLQWDINCGFVLIQS
jgi:hypothetical protein